MLVHAAVNYSTGAKGTRGVPVSGLELGRDPRQLQLLEGVLAWPLG